MDELQMLAIAIAVSLPVGALAAWLDYIITRPMNPQPLPDWEI